MIDTLGFRAAIALEPLGDDVFAAVTQNVPWPKSYGGDLLAQAAAAANETVAGDRTLHAMHSLFVAPVPIGATVRYRVERLRDGRSYSSRRVSGTVGDEVVVSALCSFHVGEASPSITEPAAPAPDPAGVPSAAQVLDGQQGAAAAYWSTGRSFDIRHVGAAPYLAPGDGARDLEVWLRAGEGLPDAAAVHALALVYACDYAMLEPALRARGLAWTTPGLATASLDHSLWFHETFRADEWLLCRLHLVSLTHGRALVRGEFFTAAGAHVATVAQQGMIRVRAVPASD